MTFGYVSFNNVVREYQNGSIITGAVDNLSFVLDKGSFNIIVGPSGAGKTTVLNILGGIDTVTSGNVIVDGLDITKLSEKELCKYRRNKIGFVFQQHNLISNLTVLENIELGLQNKSNIQKAESILKEVGLEYKEKNFPSQLSSGEQQRVAIARAVAREPKLLLCDEPTRALDYETGKNILCLLQDMCINKGVTVVVITHNLFITPMANSVINIKNGKVEKITDNPEPTPADRLDW